MDENFLRGRRPAVADDLLDDLTTYCLCSHVDYGWYYSVGGEGCPLCQAKAEIERLRRWKAEATAVNEQWDAVFDMVPHHPHDLGRSKSNIVADEIEARDAEIEARDAEIERLRAAGDALAEFVAVRLPIADGWHDETVSWLRQWQEARRG